MDKEIKQEMSEAAIKALLGEAGYEMYLKHKDKIEKEQQEVKDAVSVFLTDLGKEKLLEHTDVIVECVFERAAKEIETIGEAALVSIKMPRMAVAVLVGLDEIEKKVKGIE